jgi:hypothetical protein
VTEPKYALSERLERERHVEVARVERAVARLADDPAGSVDLREGVGELHEPLEVVHRRLAPDVPLAHERAPIDGGEDHCLTAESDAVLGVAGLEVERRRRQRDLLEHELRVEEHDLALDALARGPQQGDRLPVVERDPDVGEDPAPAPLQGRDRVRVEDLEARHAVDEHCDLRYSGATGVRHG